MYITVKREHSLHQQYSRTVFCSKNYNKPSVISFTKNRKKEGPSLSCCVYLYCQFASTGRKNIK